MNLTPKRADTFPRSLALIAALSITQCTATPVSPCHRLGTQCVDADAFPQPLWPLSLGDVTLLRPTLRWRLPTGFDGAAVDLCHDRACTRVIETLHATGSSARPTIALAPRKAVFWRLRGRVGEAESPVQSPTWLFHTPVRDAAGGVDTSTRSHNDFNGDGFDDIALGNSPRDELEFVHGVVHIYYGGVAGANASPDLIFRSGSLSVGFASSPTGAGDVNGDGFGDLLIAGLTATRNGDFHYRQYSLALYLGGPTGLATTSTMDWSESWGSSYTIAGLYAKAGDVNGDGYGDIIAGSPGYRNNAEVVVGAASIYQGTASGLSARPVRVIEGLREHGGLGFAVESLGDINGDGFSDVVVGSAYVPDPNSGLYDCTAQTYLGSSLGIGSQFAQQIAVQCVAPYGNTYLVNDFTGDGLLDLLIASNLNQHGNHQDEPALEFFSQTANGLSPAHTATFTPADCGLFVSPFVAPGDINGDGLSDIVTCAPRAVRDGMEYVGSAAIHLGTANGFANPAHQRLFGTTNYDDFGRATKCVGDVNGDGFDDFVIPADEIPNSPLAQAGRASLYLGSAVGLNPIPAQVWDGDQRRAYFGSSIAQF